MNTSLLSSSPFLFALGIPRSTGIAWIVLLVFQVALIVGIGLDYALETAAVIALLVIGAKVLTRPFLGLLLISFVHLTTHFTFVEFFRLRLFGFSWYLMDWPFWLTVLGILLYVGAGGRFRLRHLRMPIPLILVITYALFSAVLGLQRGNDPTQALYDLRPFFYYLSFALVLVVVETRERLRTLILSWLVFAGLGSLWGIFMAVTMPPELTYQGLGFFRIAGPSEAVYAMMVAFALAFLPFVHGRLRLLVFGQLALSSLAVLFGYSRASWMGLAAAFLFTVVFLGIRSPKRLRALAPVMIAVALGLYPALLAFGIDPLGVLVSRVQAGLRWSTDLPILCRLVEYRVVLADWGEHPTLGTGLGHLFTFVQPLLGRGHWVYTHSSYLYVLSKMGIVGLGLFLFMLLSFLIKGLRSVGRAEDDFLRGTALGCTAALVFLMVKSLATWTLNIFFVTMFIGLVLGVIQWIHVETSHNAMWRDGETAGR